MPVERLKRSARFVQVILIVEVLVFGISTLPGLRSEPGFVPLLDGWLQGATYVTSAVLATLGALNLREDGRLWNFVAAALTLRALAFVLFLSVVRELDPIPYPSVSDAGWLGMCIVLIVGLALFLRERFRLLSYGLLIDGVVGALAAAAVAVALLQDTLSDLAANGLSGAVLLTNMAYPVADLLLLLIILGVFVAFAWRPPRAFWMLGFGIVGFAILDSVFLYQTTAGIFRPGTPLSALSVAATAAIAYAPWVPDGTRRTGALGPLPALGIPAAFAVTCLGVMLVAATGDVSLGAVLLATTGLLLAIARTGMSFRDVRAIAQAKREARTDELTGAANRRAFNELLERALSDPRRSRGLALLVIDLDDFKDVNDSHGHHCGDELLKLVTTRLRMGLRSDEALARTGGDEFAVVLDGADETTAGRVAERLQGSLRRPFLVAGKEIVSEASIGIALFPRDGNGADELLKHADLAMYDAKAAQTGYRFFNHDRHQTARERLESVDRLHRAIVENELVLHYQPQVSLTTGRVVAVEALVRWQHPTLGLLPPARFLPQAESGGLVRLLSLSVLEQAIRQCGAWRAQGSRVVMAVNLSVINLLDAELPAQTARLLDEHGVPGEALIIELTEDLFMADPTRGGKVIHALLKSGVSIAVDDYGTGFSSLGYLRDLREISQLKLDRSFVSGLDADPRAQAIVGSTIALARALGLVLVAEGVETEAERERLAELGCKLAQGYLFSHPCPADEVELDTIPAGRSLALATAGGQ